MAETNPIKTLPVIPMRAQVVFPNTSVAFDAGRGVSLAAIERADSRDKLVFIVKQKNSEQEIPDADGLFEAGTVARIRQTTRLPGDRVRVYAEGLYRARAKEYRAEDGCILTAAEEIRSVHGDLTLEEAYFRTAKELVREIVAGDGKFSKEFEATVSVLTDIDAYIDACAHNMRLKEETKQQLLGEDRLLRRLKLFEQCLNDELEITRLERKIAQDVRRNIDKSQKEYFLREQLKAIHAELGDDVEENIK